MSSRLQQARRENERLRQALQNAYEGKQAETINSMIDQIKTLEGQLAECQSANDQEYERGRIDGWNAAVDINVKHYEPLAEAWMEVEVGLGQLKKTVEISSKTLPVEIIEELVDGITKWLGVADLPNRHMAAIIGREYYVDFAPAHKIRNAAADFVTAKDPKAKEKFAEQLRDVIKENPLSARHMKIMEEMRKRDRTRHSDTYEYAERMTQKLQRNPKPTITSAAQEVKDDWLNEKKEDIDTKAIIDAYYHVRQDTKPLLDKSIRR